MQTIHDVEIKRISGVWNKNHQKPRNSNPPLLARPVLILGALQMLLQGHAMTIHGGQGVLKTHYRLQCGNAAHIPSREKALDDDPKNLSYLHHTSIIQHRLQT